MVSDEFLRRIVITGRSDLGIPAYNESKGRSDEFQPLTSKEINDVVAPLASRRSKADCTDKSTFALGHHGPELPTPRNVTKNCVPLSHSLSCGRGPTKSPTT